MLGNTINTSNPENYYLPNGVPRDIHSRDWGIVMAVEIALRIHAGEGESSLTRSGKELICAGNLLLEPPDVLRRYDRSEKISQRTAFALVWALI